MPHYCFTVFLVGIAGLLWLEPSRAFAQASAEPSAATAEAASGARGRQNEHNKGMLREAKPELYYLQDKDGNLVLVPTFSFEEWQELVQKAAGLVDDPPAFTIKKISISGAAKDDHAELDIRFQIRLTQGELDSSMPMSTRPSWVRVPLMLHTAILRAPPEHEGPGESITDFEKNGEGYVCWLKAAEGTEHHVSLKVAVPLVQVGGATRLALTTPQYSTELKLAVSTPRVEAELGNGDQRVSLLSKNPLPNGQTELMVESTGGDLQLAWQEGSAQASKPPVVLEASGSVLVKIEGRQSISSEAQLNLRSYGGPIDSFRVRLPAGMQLFPVNQTGFQVSVVSAEGDESSQRKGQLVEVKLDRKTTGPVDVRLLAEMIPQGEQAAQLELPGQQDAESLLETAGFEVVGAARQRGHIDFAVEGDWSVRWMEGSNVRRVDELPEALRQQKVVARFEYFRQPCSLKVQVLPKQTRVRVSPTYVLHAEAGQVRLDATFKYQVRGAKAYSPKIDFADWKVDRITPEGLLQFELLDLEKTMPLDVPLNSSAPTGTGEFELRIQAHRDLDEAQQNLSFPLPRPRESTQTPALVAIVPADNVELAPLSKQMAGLVPETLPPLLDLPSRQQPPLFFRTRGAAEPAIFVSDFQVRPQSVLVGATSQVQLREGQVQVEQRLSYRIAYEPLKQVLLDVPQALVQAGDLNVSLEGAALPLTLMSEEEVSAEAMQRGEPRVRLLVDLLKHRIGTCELLVTYPLPAVPLELEESVLLPIPLVLPTPGVNTMLTTHTLNVTFPDALQVELGAGQWSPIVRDGSKGPSRRQLELIGDMETDQLGLAVTLAEAQKHNSTLVHQAWVQTWLAPHARRDRAVFRLTTSDPRIQLQLPKDAQLEDLEVALNGRAVAHVAVTAPEEISFDVQRDGDHPQGTYVVELWYGFRQGRPPRGLISLDLPQVKGSGQIKRLYWQLVTPPQEHLCWGPAGLTPELQWRWLDRYWGRRGTLSQQELEKWIGASPQAPLPEAANEYLFTSFGTVEQLELVTASRQSLLLILSGVALIAGLLLIYYPALRHPALLLTAGLALVAGALWLPELALLAAQAASLGLLLLLLAGLLEWTLVRRRYGPPARHSSSYLNTDSKTLELQYPRPEAGSHATTATAPLLSSLPGGEPKS